MCCVLLVGCSAATERVLGPADAACAVLAAEDLDAVLVGTAGPGTPSTSDSGPPGLVGCSWASSGTFVTVWLLRRDAAAMYATQVRAVDGREPLDVPDGQGFVTSDGGGESAFLLRHGVYLDVDVTRQTGAVPAATASRLAGRALTRLP